MQNEVSQPVTMDDHLDDAADSLRAALHQAYGSPPADPDGVAALYRSIGSADRLAAMLPQLLRHLATHAEALGSADGLDTDASTDLDGPGAASAISEALAAASVTLAGLASGQQSPIATAHNLASTLKFPHFGD